MTIARKRFISIVITTCGCVGAAAQAPDLINTFEMGGRAYGMGGAIYSNSTDPSASYWNPAGLAFVPQAMGELNFRNLPASDTELSGTFVKPDRKTSTSPGGNSFSFAGFAMPFKGGVLGISYAIGGAVRDASQGTNLASGDPSDPTQVQVQSELFKLRNEFLTIAWGNRRGTGTAIGIGVVVARQSIGDRFFQRVVDGGGNPIGITSTDESEVGTGVGGIIGVQFIPAGNPNLSMGVSYRSEIKLSGFDVLSAFSNAIPARLQGGFAWRVDNLRGGRDYLIGGVDASYFFPANKGRILERDGQISAGTGFEYNWAQSWGYLPIRVGYRYTDKGGEGFTKRDALTFGVGYRPHNGALGIDIAIGVSSGQKSPNFTASATFQIGK